MRITSSVTRCCNEKQTNFSQKLPKCSHIHFYFYNDVFKIAQRSSNIWALCIRKFVTKKFNVVTLITSCELPVRQIDCCVQSQVKNYTCVCEIFLLQTLRWLKRLSWGGGTNDADQRRRKQLFDQISKPMFLLNNFPSNFCLKEKVYFVPTFPSEKKKKFHKVCSK